jgi:hypothetical protein
LKTPCFAGAGGKPFGKSCLTALPLGKGKGKGRATYRCQITQVKDEAVKDKKKNKLNKYD